MMQYLFNKLSRCSALLAITVFAVLLSGCGDKAEYEIVSEETQDIEPAQNAADLFLPQGSIERGEELAKATCNGCHGPAGNSINGSQPKLAGQHAKYIYEQLHAFQEKENEEGDFEAERVNMVMVSQVANLSDQDMMDLSVYYAAQINEMNEQGADKYLTLGVKLYRGGDANREIPACIACHGPLAGGNAGVPYPMLQGQHYEYTKKRLLEFRNQALKVGEAELDETTEAMLAISARLSDTEIEALSYTLQGMREWEPTEVVEASPEEAGEAPAEK